MIFQRAAQREFAQTAATVFVALFAIMLTTQLIRLLGQAAGGKIASDGVVALLGFGAINYLPMLLSLTLFISVLMTLSRSYRDSEMAIWFSAGVPLTAWVRPVLKFALPLVLVIAVLVAVSFAVGADQERGVPAAHGSARRRFARLARRVPGVGAGRTRVLRRGPDRRGRAGQERLRQFTVQHGRLGVVAAAEGRTEMAANGDRFLVLEQGRRYEGTPGAADYRVMEFERYGVRIETRESRGIEPTQKNMTIWELLRQPTPVNLGELLWRIGIPLVGAESGVAGDPAVVRQSARGPHQQSRVSRC